MTLKNTFKNATESTPFERLCYVFQGIRKRMDIRESLTRDLLIHTKPGSITDKKEQIAQISEDIQTALRSLQITNDLNNIEIETLSSTQKRYLDEMVLMCSIETSLSPEDAVISNSIETEGRHLHSTVKASNDWDTAKDWLKEVVTFKRKQGQAIAKKLSLDTPYEGLLQIFCPGTTEADLTHHFDTIIPQVKQVMEQASKQQSGKYHDLEGEFPIEKQLALFKNVLAHMGFDFNRGDLYITEHDPIEGGTRNDARVVINHLKPDGKSFITSLKSAIHEGAHGINLQNLPQHEQYSLLGMQQGTDLWEAIALGYEMVLSRTPEFSQFIANTANKHFGENRINGEHLHGLRTHIEPGLDRKSADPISYHLHIAIRYDLEKRLINGDLEVEDLPNEWNRLYEKTIGVTPDTEAEGVLQDVHWCVGKFGYFPAYSLGVMQFTHLNEEQIGSNHNYKEDLTNGDFSKITEWFTDNVFAQGRLVDKDTLLKNATGVDFNSEAFVEYLTKTFTSPQTPAMSNTIK